MALMGHHKRAPPGLPSKRKSFELELLKHVPGSQWWQSKKRSGDEQSLVEKKER